MSVPSDHVQVSIITRLCNAAGDVLKLTQREGGKRKSTLLPVLLTFGRRRMKPGSPLVSSYPHEDQNSPLVSVADFVPWQQCHISMETQAYICL